VTPQESSKAQALLQALTVRRQVEQASSRQVEQPWAVQEKLVQRVQQIWRPGRQSTDRRSMLTPGLAKRDGGARAGGAEKSASCSSTSNLPEALIGGDAAGLAKRAGGARAGGAEKSSSSSSPPNFPDALIGGEDGVRVENPSSTVPLEADCPSFHRGGSERDGPGR